jgi:hypothetical protein
VLHRLEEPQELQRALDAAGSLLRARLPKAAGTQTPNESDWSVFEKYVPHVLALHTAYAGSGPALKGTMQFASLLSDIDMFLWERMIGGEGVPSLETALQILERPQFSGRAVDVMKSDIHVVLGILYCFQGLRSRKDEILHKQEQKSFAKSCIWSCRPRKLRARMKFVSTTPEPTWLSAWLR